MDEFSKEGKIADERNLLNRYYNYLMDYFDGKASHESIELFIVQEFKHSQPQQRLQEEILKILKEEISIRQSGYMNACADLEGLGDASEKIELLFIERCIKEAQAKTNTNEPKDEQ